MPARGSVAFAEALDYAKAQRTTGFLIVQDRCVLVERNWPLPDKAQAFARSFVHGASADGALLEDVASQQKSFIAVLAGIAVDKGLLDVGLPVSDYIGPGWSKASTAQEAKVTVQHLLEMNSGLAFDFTYAAPPGARFVYNTPVYAVMKAVLAKASHRSLDEITTAWMTLPLGMSDTGWRKRPGGFAANPTGLVTTPRDAARLGQMILDGGLAPGGRRVISAGQLAALFKRTPTNPAYGRLWWLNGGAFALRPSLTGAETRQDGPLIRSAPADLVAALGAEDRKLYVSPSHKLIVVRLGQQAPDRDFDTQLWQRLMRGLEAVR